MRGCMDGRLDDLMTSGYGFWVKSNQAFHIFFLQFNAQERKGDGQIWKLISSEIFPLLTFHMFRRKRGSNCCCSEPEEFPKPSQIDVWKSLLYGDWWVVNGLIKGSNWEADRVTNMWKSPWDRWWDGLCFCLTLVLDRITRPAASIHTGGILI